MPSSVTFCWSERAPRDRSVSRVRRAGVARRDEDCARLQAQEVHDVLRLDRQPRNRLVVHRLADAGVNRVDDRRGFRDRHRLGDAADRKRRVRPGREVDLKDDVLAHCTRRTRSVRL